MIKNYAINAQKYFENKNQNKKKKSQINHNMIR